LEKKINTLYGKCLVSVQLEYSDPITRDVFSQDGSISIRDMNGNEVEIYHVSDGNTCTISFRLGTLFGTGRNQFYI
jgi:hypothetical protein